jgi:hypothetical protein
LGFKIRWVILILVKIIGKDEEHVHHQRDNGEPIAGEGPSGLTLKEI